jgi:CubicO group peptidase (beta-lactamase class C family)
MVLQKEFHMRVRLLVILMLVTLGISPGGLAQSAAQSGATNQLDLSPRVDAVFAEYSKASSPGCVLGVIQNGKIVYSRGYGLANLEHNIPITPKTVFDIGSTSKQFTAASILLLAQEGKLSLDDDIRKHIPEMPAYGKPVTIRHLLHHTSGIRDYLSLMELAGVDFDGVTTGDDALDLIKKQKGLNFTPGDEHLYSNSGYFLLSVIVKRASGKSLRQFAEEKIFAPLGMKNTHFHDDHTMIVPLRATGYAPAQGGGFAIAMSGFEQTGDGAVMTTIEDLFLWDQNFYQPKVGGKEMIAGLLETGRLNNGEKLEYARGLMVTQYKGLPMVSHGGSWAGYRAEMIRFPEQQFSIACLCNTGASNPTRLASQVADIYLADKLAVKAENQPAKTTDKPAAVTLSAGELQTKAGLYRNSTTGAFRKVLIKDGKLRLDLFGPSYELLPVSATRFVIARPPFDIKLDFEASSAGGARKLTITRGDGRQELFEAVEAVDPAKIQLAEYAGTYYSEELDTTYSIEITDGALIMKRGRAPGRPLLQPTVRDGFASLGGVQVEFARETQGRVAGFHFSAGRIRGVRFVKQAR